MEVGMALTQAQIDEMERKRREAGLTTGNAGGNFWTDDINSEASRQKIANFKEWATTPLWDENTPVLGSKWWTTVPPPSDIVRPSAPEVKGGVAMMGEQFSTPPPAPPVVEPPPNYFNPEFSSPIPPPNYFNPAFSSPVEVPPPAYNPNAGTGVFIRGADGKMVERTRGQTDMGQGVISKPTANDAIFKDISGLNVNVSSMANKAGDVAFGRGQGGVSAAPTNSIMSGTWKPAKPEVVAPTTAAPQATAQPAAAPQGTRTVRASDAIARQIAQTDREIAELEKPDPTGRLGGGAQPDGRVVIPRERKQQRLNNIAIKQRQREGLQAQYLEAVKTDNAAEVERYKLGQTDAQMQETERSNRAKENNDTIGHAVKIWEAAGKSREEAAEHARGLKEAAAKRDEERTYNEKQKAAEIARGNVEKAKEWDMKLYELDSKAIDSDMKELAVAIGPNGVPMKQTARGGWEPITAADRFMGYDPSTNTWTDKALYDSIVAQQTALQKRKEALERKRATLGKTPQGGGKANWQSSKV
jgi:hypothetical protein